MTDRTCSVDDCEKRVIARGWCNMHYQRWQAHGDPLAVGRWKGKPTCSVEACGGESNARGLCGRHYQQARRDGSLPPKVARPRSCSVPGCHRHVYGQGLCNGHWTRLRTIGELEPSSLEPLDSKPPFGQKWCRGCKSYLPLSEFYVSKKGPEGPCKQCRAIRGKAYRKANPPRTKSDKNRRRRALLRAAKSEPYTAIEIAERDGWRCQICGERIGRTLRFPHARSLSIDHIVPLAVGGDDVRINVQAAHLRCNVAKRTRGVDQLRLIG